MKDFDFDTNELLSSLDKLKEKYSFNFDEEEAKPEPVTPIIEDEAEEPEDITIKISPIVDATPEKETVEKKEESAITDMSWLIDGDDVSDEDDQDVYEADEAINEPEEESIQAPEIKEEIIADEPVVEEENPVAWYLMTDENSEEEYESDEEIAEEEEEIAAAEEEPVASEEETEEADEYEEEVQEQAPITEEAVDNEDNDDDDFDDLDDDLVVIRHDESETEKVKEESKQEESPFFAAFRDELSSESNNTKPPKPVKPAKPAKPVKEPKEKKEKQPKKNNPRKKLILNIIVGVALVIGLWICIFMTDVLLVSNWSAPVFCAESESYDDGSKTYTGAFYQIQICVNDDGTIDRVSLPWFAKGPNGEK